MARKIAVFTIGIILILLMVSERISFLNSMDLLKKSMEQRVTTIALTTANLTREALAMNFLSFLQEEVIEIKKANPDVIHALIIDNENSILAHTNQDLVLEEHKGQLAEELKLTWLDDSLEIQAPIKGNKRIEGNLVFSVNISSLNDARSKIIMNSLIKIAGVILAGIILSMWVASRVAKPLNLLSSYAHRLPSLDFSVMEEENGRDQIDELPEKYKDEVGKLAESFIFMESELKRNIRHLMKTTAIKERIEGELNVAREIQLGLVPKQFPAFPGNTEFDLYATLKPARAVGGDLYDYFLIDNSHLCFALGDVSDKGVPAALFMGVTKTLIKSFFRTEMSPSKVMSMINNALNVENPRSMFVTLILGVLNLKTGELAYANGGHNPPILINNGEKASYKTEISGPVVGAMGGLPFKELKIQLQPDDALFYYTDGVNEAMDEMENVFSNERLLDEISKISDQSPKAVIDKILVKIEEHVGDAPQSDDIAMMMIKFNG